MCRLRHGVWKRVAAVSVTLVIVVTSPLIHAEDESDGDKICALNSAIDTWGKAIRFQATYKIYQRFATDIDNGLSGEFAKEDENPNVMGFIAKDGNAYRLIVDYGKPPVDASLAGDKSVLTNVSFDEVLSRDLYLIYEPQYGEFGNSVIISVRPADKRGTFLGVNSTDVLSAFSFGGGVDGGPIRSLHALVAPDDSWVQHVISDKDGRCVVQLLWSNNHGMKHERTVTFWTQPPVPVVEKVEDHFQDAQRGLENRSITKAEGFTSCEGGMLASRVISVSGPLPKPLSVSGPADNSFDHSAYVVTEWIASEITSSLDEDCFDVTVPAGTSINGLKYQPSTDRGPTRLRLSYFTIDDIRLNSGIEFPAQ